MSNFNDLPQCKPSIKVENTLLDIHKKLDCMKVDIGVIKSDLKIILDRIDLKQKQEDQILRHQVKKQDSLSKGWFFTY